MVARVDVPLSITLGSGRKDPQGERVQVDPDELAGVLEAHEGVEAWWSGHVWRTDYRDADQWERSALIAVDLDYGVYVETETPSGRPKIKSSKLEVPDEQRQRIADAWDFGDFCPDAAWAHPTPHGHRVIWRLTAESTDPDEWARAAAGACRSAFDSLVALGLPLVSRDQVGIHGWHVDESASTDRARLYFAPRAFVDKHRRNGRVQERAGATTTAEHLASLVPQAEAEETQAPEIPDEVLSRMGDAAKRWAQDHPLDIPLRGARVDCPACESERCLGQVPHLEGRVACHSESHKHLEPSCGSPSRSGACYVFDALDLEAWRRAGERGHPVRRSDVLREDGYLGPSPLPDHPTTDEDREWEERLAQVDAATEAAVSIRIDPTVANLLGQLNDAANRGENRRAENICVTLHRELVGERATSTPTAALALPDAWDPYPCELLPGWARLYVEEAALANAVDPSWIALSLLVSSAALIGRTRVVELENGHTEPAVLWGAVAGGSGSRKSAAVKAGAYGFGKVAIRAREEYERALTSWNTENADRPKSQREQYPPRLRPEIDDATVEAVVQALQDNPRGLLLLRDELGGFLAGIGEYKKGSMADAARWCSMYDAARVVVDRKTEHYHAYVAAAAVSLLGGIQPATLRALYGETGSEQEHVELGLVPRLMFAMPPEVPRAPPRHRVPKERKVAAEECAHRLWYELRMRADARNRQVPTTVRLEAAAEDDYWRFWQAQEDARRAEPDPCLAAVLSKSTGLALRLALVLAYLEGQPAMLSTADLQLGIELAKWHAREARRVAFLFRGSEADHVALKVLDWIQRNPGRTARDIQAHVRGIKNADEGGRILEALEQAGRIRSEQAPNTGRGRPTARFYPSGICVDDPQTGGVYTNRAAGRP